MSHAAILTLSEAESWRSYLRQLPDTDFTFFPEFAQIYQEYGDGRAECFVFNDDNGIMLYPFIRRPLSNLPFDNDYTNYFDIVTPYCYGGIIGRIEDQKYSRQFLRAFRESFCAFAGDTRIVSEFIRFHPLIFVPEPWDGLFQELALNSHNVVIDLTRSEESIIAGYRRRLRGYIRATESSGVTIRLDEDFAHTDAFFEMYAQNMARHGQKGYLNFRKSFFDKLSALPNDHLELYMAFVGEEPVAGAYFLRYGEIMDYFLAASADLNSNLRPAHFLVHQAMLAAKASGVRTLHLGAGHDSLRFFKRGFSRQTIPYFVGRHIHDERAYRDLIASRMKIVPPLSMQLPYFPVYRSGLE